MADVEWLRGDRVLIVDDIPDNLSLLHDALDEAGYTVLVATNGPSALARAVQAQPDVILLDAVMPGMDGFEVARKLKAHPETGAIPIVFMTGLTETEHVVAAFEAGGADYVTKPIRPREVLARIAAHMQNARLTRQARDALDTFGQATLAMAPDGSRLAWQTPEASRLLQLFDLAEPGLPPAVVNWLAGALQARRAGGEPLPFSLNGLQGRLVFQLAGQGRGGEWLVAVRMESDAAAVESLVQAFRLTQREAEVLYWVIKGKTNRDIGDILGTSPRTVHKHLEHVFGKLGVETRTAAAALALPRLRGGGEAAG
ncbi:MAG: response regulator [Zoogloeaceae bacterium]|nr:response regulator [Zoogloeaceae bacterium]